MHKAGMPKRIRMALSQLRAHNSAESGQSACIGYTLTKCITSTMAVWSVAGRRRASTWTMTPLTEPIPLSLGPWVQHPIDHCEVTLSRLQPPAYRSNRKGKPVNKTKRVLLLALALVSPFTMGCGNGSKVNQAPPTRGTGTLRIEINWPRPSRLVPSAAQSITIEVSSSGQDITPKTIARPPDGTNTSVATFDDLRSE